ncbi:MAG: ORF6N domain-containing protein [Roseburia sp.]|nr:ORF6N domain-containing protein [Roseburia sp.]
MILFQIMVLYAGERCDHMANENKNNKEKFEGDDFMFQLTKDEWENLRYKKFTSSWGGSRYLQLSMQISQNIHTTMELRSDLNDVEDQMAEVMDKLSNVVTRSELSEVMNEFGEPHIKCGYLVLNGNPFRADVVPNLSIQLFYSRGIFHDRYIILDYDTDDEKIYLCGGSSKDAGGRITSILEDPDRAKYDSMIKDLLKNNQLILK